MLRKINWMVLAGMVMILAGGINAWMDYRQAADVSPFDLVDDGQDFIPILSAVEEDEAVSFAPTLAADEPRRDAPTAPLPVGEEDALQPPLTGSIPERLVIASIGLDAPIVPVHYRDIEFDGQIYHQWRVPAEFAAGWQDTSARLGLPGNTVLNGHHNAYGRVFENLVELRVGDVIQIYAAEWEYRYTVVAKMLLPERGQPLPVRMENARWLSASEDERLTLVTCWPAESNSHRVIVIAYPIGRPIPHLVSAADAP